MRRPEPGGTWRPAGAPAGTPAPTAGIEQQIATLRSSLDAQTQKLKQEMMAHDAARRSLAEAKSRLEASRSELRDLQDQLQTQEAEAEAEALEQRKLQEQLDQIKREHAELAAKVKAEKDSLSELRASVTAELEQINERIKEAYARYDANAVAAAIRKAQEEIAALEGPPEAPPAPAPPPPPPEPPAQPSPEEVKARAELAKKIEAARRAFEGARPAEAGGEEALQEAREQREEAGRRREAAAERRRAGEGFIDAARRGEATDEQLAPYLVERPARAQLGAVDAARADREERALLEAEEKALAEEFERLNRAIGEWDTTLDALEQSYRDEEEVMGSLSCPNPACRAGPGSMQPPRERERELPPVPRFTG
eukprot:tig00000949_g5738.t1